VRKVVKDTKSKVNLITLMSNTRDFSGSEVPLRGGFIQMTNIDEEINQLFVKFKSINLCSNSQS